jgi:hypothetical protein
MAGSLINRVLHVGAVCYVTAHNKTFGTKPVQFCCNLLAALAINVRKCDASTLFCQAQGGGSSYSSTGSGDKSNSSIKPSHVWLSPFSYFLYPW